MVCDGVAASYQQASGREVSRRRGAGEIRSGYEIFKEKHLTRVAKSYKGQVSTREKGGGGGDVAGRDRGAVRRECGAGGPADQGTGSCQCGWDRIYGFQHVEQAQDGAQRATAFGTCVPVLLREGVLAG